MLQKRIYFKGLLTNTDSSILKINLSHGFNIKAFSEKEGVSLISSLEGGLSSREVYRRLFMEYPCLNTSEKNFYTISNSLEKPIEIGNKGFSEVAKFNNSFVHGYLEPTIRLMRLFKEGDIRMPFKYYYCMDDNVPKSFMSSWMHRHISTESYHLEDSELPDFQKFIQDTKLPFTESFLHLAFDNFELSYETANMNLSFLSLMVSLETLFNPGGEELRYRVSRNTAVLFGKDKEDSKRIFSEVKDLYDKRSGIVHGGKSKIIKKEDLLKLRHYVRESIKEINKMGKNKGELLDLLDSCGFGDRVWIEQ